VGTSLIVIIPEGIETLYSAKSTESIHHRRSLSIGGTRSEDAFGTQRSHSVPNPGIRDVGIVEGLQALHVRIDQGGSGIAGPEDGKPVSDHDIPKQGMPHITTPVGKEEQGEVNDHEEDTAHHDFEPHAWVGISVIAGFILMYLIDNIPKIAASSAHMQPSYISLDRLGLRRGASDAEDDDDIGDSGRSRYLPSSTTTGLVIHSAADGIALGASSTSSSPKLGFVVFLALMIHKAPAAFGLTAVLLKQGLSKRRIKTHLLIFSLAAPVGALATWAVVQLFGSRLAEGATTTEFSTGLLLLFSGGTFL